MIDFSSAETATVEYIGDQWRLTILDGTGTALAETGLPLFGPENFFVRASSDQPAGLDYVRPFLNKRGLYYTQWAGCGQDGWSTQLHY
ncbi:MULTISPECIES: hypothetical protein [unclassified Rathayibacter]|uniref:hypothetical protein n=1 Tax=unclassified Rathayibacter TaxID=2609250 RepID=UPI000F4BFA35|nr:MULTISPECIES: hypothetical protein [unclassified Rathayibacter]ROP44388.1 hypothetical protein EDF45_3854 [Rathayibacter sp. PhB186]ROS46944.1 hypothetical protein EDF44_3845 [Rathayibacter sp. PhB185]